jgi:hypothetical protein
MAGKQNSAFSEMHSMFLPNKFNDERMTKKQLNVACFYLLFTFIMISPFLCENVNSHPCLKKASLPVGLSSDVKYYYYYFFTFPIRGGAVNVCLHFDSKRCTVIVTVIEETKKMSIYVFAILLLMMMLLLLLLSL